MFTSCSSKRTLFSNLCFYSKTSIFRVLRTYCTKLEKELDVPTFCDIHVNLPYSVSVKPLNVHRYHNCDKLIIQQDGQVSGDTLKCYVDGNHVQIEDVAKKNDSYVCNIRAPVKANLYINSLRNISVGCFNGDKVSLTSNEGNITLRKYQGNCVKLTTNNGDITLSESLLASSIEASVIENGSIHCGKLQGTKLKLKTQNGDIKVESAYCDESEFEIGKGNLELCNAHRSCKVSLKDGEMSLTCFDGKLSALLMKGAAKIHLSRVSEDSKITIEEGTLDLKISESCLDYSKFVIESSECDIGKEFVTDVAAQNAVISMDSKLKEENTVFVSCLKGRVTVESVSWQEMLKQIMNKNKANVSTTV